MKRLMLPMLGFDLERIPAGAETEFVWTHAPASWGVFVFAAVAAALLYGSFRLYRRESDLCPPRIKRVLAVLRLSTLLVLLCVLLGPALSIVL
jgi:hypothetical protein